MTEETKPRKTTKAQWKKSAVHEDVTLPSGAVVDIKLPNLPKLIESGQIPSALVEATSEVAQKIGGASNPGIGVDLMKNHREFTVKILPLTVVNPEITEEDVTNEVVPYEDQEFLVLLATRNRDFDAVGHHLGGLHTQEEFRRFRGISSGDEGLEGL